MEINTAGYNEFLSCIKDMVLGDPKSIEVFADGLGVSVSHLYQKLDPNYPDAKLHAREAFILMMNCENPQPLLMLCGKKSLSVSNLDGVEPDKDTVEKELLDNASAYARYQGVLADPNSTEDDAIKARMKLDDELNQDHVLFCRARAKGHVYAPGGTMRTTHIPSAKRGAHQ